MKVTNEPVDGRERENWLIVLPSSAIAIVAAITVNGEAIPAVATIVANEKKKLIAGAMSANGRAAISQVLRTPRANRPSSDEGGPTASLAPAPVIAMSYPSSEQTALKTGAYIPSPAGLTAL